MSDTPRYPCLVLDHDDTVTDSTAHISRLVLILFKLSFVIDSSHCLIQALVKGIIVQFVL